MTYPTSVSHPQLHTLPGALSTSHFGYDHYSDDEWEYEYDDNETEDHYIIADFSGIKIPGFFAKAFPQRPNIPTATGAGGGGGGDEDEEQAEFAEDNQDDDEDDEDDEAGPSSSSGSKQKRRDKGDENDDAEIEDEEDDEEDVLPPDSLFENLQKAKEGDDDDDDEGEEDRDKRDSKPIQILGLDTRNPVIAFGGSIFSCVWASTVGTDMLFMPAADLAMMDSRAGAAAETASGRPNKGTPSEAEAETVAGGEDDGDVEMVDTDPLLSQQDQAAGKEQETELQSRTAPPPLPIIPLRSFTNHDLIGISATRLLARPAKLVPKPGFPSHPHAVGGPTSLSNRLQNPRVPAQPLTPSSTLLSASSPSSSSIPSFPFQTMGRKVIVPAKSNAQLEFLNSLKGIMVEKGEPGVVKFGASSSSISARPPGSGTLGTTTTTTTLTPVPASAPTPASGPPGAAADADKPDLETK